MTMTEQERFEKWWNDSGMKAFDLDGYHCAAEAWVAALDRPSLADDPDDDVEFCKWREDHNIDLGDKWVAWGAWQGAIQRFALDRSSDSKTVAWYVPAVGAFYLSEQSISKNDRNFPIKELIERPASDHPSDAQEPK
jgi:hypothetical protein